MAYLALYRQWRPQRFSDFVGQEAVITALKNQVAAGRIAHAYLFCGSRGTGKTSAAQVFARAINCQTPVEGESCGACESCRKLSEENNLDIVEIDAASNNGVDEIRDLRDKVAYPPQEGRYRVYIIDEVHMLSQGAFNALLKTLEEPPSHAVFILATTEPQRLPATILSRCQRYDFRRIPLAQITGRLAQAVSRAGQEATPQALQRIGRAAEGGMRDALSILDMCLSLSPGVLEEGTVLDVLGASGREFLFAFAQALIDGDAVKVMDAIAEMVSLGREVSVFARDVLQHLRQLMLAQSCPQGLADLLELTEEDAVRLKEQAQGVSRARLLSMMDLFLTADTDLKWASQPRIALEMAAVRAAMPPQAVGADTALLEERIEALERKLAQGFEAPASQRQEVTSSVPKAAQPAPQAPPERAPQPVSPAPGPQAVEVAGGRSAAAVWKDFEGALKREAPALYSMVKQGRLLGREGTTYRLGFPPAGQIYLNMLQKEPKLQTLEKALQEAAQGPASLALEIEQEESASSAASPGEALQKVFDTFGRENVQVLREEP